MYYLDHDNKKTLQLSNDAFFYLLNEEEPLDSDNMEEALEVLALFPGGYEIEEDWSYVDADLIETTFVPYKKVAESSFDWDMQFELAKSFIVQIRWIVFNSRLEAVKFNPLTGETKNLGEFDVKVNNYGLDYFEIPSTLNSIPTTLYVNKFTKRGERL